MEFVLIEGACHCGNIRFALEWPGADREIPRRRCGCTFCTKHGGVWTSNPDARLAVSVTDESRLSRYRFGTGTADFLVCASCGVVPVAACDIDGTTYAVVNVNTFAETPGFTFPTTATDFDGEDTGSRLARRQRNWIPGVSISTPPA